MGGYAWVTLATNDSYSLGALVLAHSLKNSNTTAKLAVLITPAVSQPMRDQLQATFDLVKLVDVLDSKDEAHLALLKRPELGVTFTKIHCWTLTEFEKCVFLDADTMVVRNCDELFERDEFSAAPDVSWPDCFNSGVFVYKPSVETFNKLLQYAVDFGSFDGGDQGLLNQFFSDWATEDIKKHLPFVYNLTTVAVYSYIPAFKKYGSETRIVHFIGNGKPWLHQLDPSTKTITPISGSEHLTPLLQKWWDIFCEKVHPSLNKGLDRDNESVDACTDSVAVEFSDECESACLLEPDTPYREENDYRQFNLPYQPFDVVSSSGELLNVGFSFTFDEDSRKDDEPGGNIRESAVQKVEIVERREDDSAEDEKRRKSFENTECEKMEEVVECFEREYFVEEICCENKEDVTNEPEFKEIKATRVETEKAPFYFDNFFPDDVCVNNYLEQNVKQYQPFSCCPDVVVETCQTLNNFNNIENTQHNQEPLVPQLPRFLTMPEDDKRQSGNIPFISKPKDPLSPPPSPPLPPQYVPFRSDSNNEPQCSNENDAQELLNETVCTSSENSHNTNHEQTIIKRTTIIKPLSKSKSTSNLIFDAMSVDQYLPIDSTSSRQSISKLELNRRFSMPKLKPLLPKHSAFYKSTPSVVPKVTLYTELLMSSEYKDPLNLPIDKEGFVENQIVKQSHLRRTKSDDNLRAKFGPLPYAADFKNLMSPKFHRSSVSLNECGLYDLKDCKRQLGNKPKPVENDSTTNVPKSQCKSISRKRKRKEQHIYEKRENFGNEKRIKKDRKNEKIQTKEKKASPIFSSFSNDYSKRTNNVSEILKRLIDFSKDYLHYFGDLNRENPKSSCQSCTKYQSLVERKNAMIQTGSVSPGKPENLYELYYASTPTIRKYENNSARGDSFKVTPSKGFERFRNFVYDQSETTQKGLMGMQDVLKENASSSDKSLGMRAERHRNDESSYEKYSRVGDTKRMTYQMILFRDFQRWKRRFEEEYGIVPLLRGGNIWSRTTIPLPWLKHTLNWNGSPGTVLSQNLKSQRDSFINKTNSNFRHLNGGSCHPIISGTNNKKSLPVGDYFKTSKSFLKTPFNSPSTSTVTIPKHSKNCIKSKRYNIEHRLPPDDSPEGNLSQQLTTSQRHNEQSNELTVNSKNKLFNGIRTAATFKTTDTSNLLANDSNRGRSRGNCVTETGNNSGIAGAIAQLDLENGTKKDNPSPGRESSAHEEYLRRQNWETGNMDYMGRDSFDNIWSKICKTLEDKAPGEKTQDLKDGKKLLESKGESKEPNSQAAPVDLAASSVPNSGLIQSPVTSLPPIAPSAVLLEAVGVTPVSTTAAVSPKAFEPPKTDLLKSVAENAYMSIATPGTPDVSSLSSQLSASKAEETTPVSPVETNIPALTLMPVQTPPSSQVTDSKEIPLGKSDTAVCVPQSPPAPPSTKTILQGTTPSNTSGTLSGSLPPIVTAPPPATDVPQPASEKSPTTMQPLSTAPLEGTKTPTTKDTQVRLTNQAQVSITETPPTPLEKDAKECELAPCSKEEKKEEKSQESKIQKQPEEKNNSKPDSKSSGDDKNTAVVPYCDVFQSAKNAQAAEPRTDKESHRKSVEETIKKQGEAKSDQFPPIPLPESPTEVKPPMELSSVQKNSKESSPKEEKKGMISKILDFVGVSPKGKDGESEGSKSTFYDVGAAETPAQPKSTENQTSEVQPADKPVSKPDDKVQEPTNESVQVVKGNSDKEKPIQPVATEEKKCENKTGNDNDNQKEIDKKSSKKNKGKSPKPPPAGDKKRDSKHPEPEKKPDVPSKESAQGNRGNQKDKSKSKQDNKQANAGEKKGEAPKAPEQQQTKPTDEPKTRENAVKNKKKSPSPNLSLSEPVSPAESEPPKPAFLTIDNTIPDTPPASGMKPAASESETMATVEGKVKKEVDAIIDKAKTVVENQLENRKSAEEQVPGSSAQVSDKNEEVNALKMIADEGKGAVKRDSKPSQQQQQHHHQGKQKNQQDQKGKRGSQKHGASHSQVRPEEIEEIKVTSEEERKRHKTEPATSKLSEQILKAIPPPRRKAISESKADTPPTTPPPDTDTRPEPEAKPEPKSEAKPEPQQPEVPKSEPKKPEVQKPGESAKANAGAVGPKGKSVSEPVPPPRNKSKPRQKTPPKGKPKK